MKNTKVISAFPACGKSYMFNKYKDNEFIKILDSDSSGFHWCYDENNNKIPNPEWPKNYIDHIKYNIGKVDIIFVSSHKEIRTLLFENDIPYEIVVPCRRETCMYEWIGRMYCRKNSNEFINNIITNWNKWLLEIEYEHSYENIIYLNENEYIEDILWFNAYTDSLHDE